MSDVRLALHKILEEATGDPHFFETFEKDYKKRLIAQKVIYLLKSRFGMNVPWSFNWYIAGPYSPSLAHDLYATAHDLEAVRARARSFKLKASVMDKIEQLRHLLHADVDKLGLDMAGWAELLASIDYISRWSNIPLDSPALVAQVKRAKPKFNEDQITQGIQYLAGYGSWQH